MLGWLKDIGDLVGSEFNLLNASDPSSTKYFVGLGAPFCMDHDPGHGYSDTTAQIFGGSQKESMSGFVENFVHGHSGTAQNIMNCYTPDQVPVISTLATEFSCATHYFPSFPGPTGPNRMFMHTATTMGYDGGQYDGYPLAARSIYEDLFDEGHSFEIRWQDFTTAHGIVPLSSNVTLNSRIVQDLGFEKFLPMLASGKGLADYTVLVPLLGPNGQRKPNSQHPAYDIRPGEALIKQVYETLRNSPYWNDTLLILTYDEHGGFWDKMAPPTNVSNPCPNCTAHPDPFAFDRLGVRIPTIFISQWSPKGVDSTQYEGASVPATVRAIFNLSTPPLSPRMAEAATFNKFLSQPRTDCPAKLPEVYPGACTPSAPQLTSVAMEMAQMYLDLARRHLVASDSRLDQLEEMFRRISCDEDAGNFRIAAAKAHTEALATQS